MRPIIDHFRTPPYHIKARGSRWLRPPARRRRLSAAWRAARHWSKLATPSTPARRLPRRRLPGRDSTAASAARSESVPTVKEWPARFVSAWPSGAAAASATLRPRSPQPRRSRLRLGDEDPRLAGRPGPWRTCCASAGSTGVRRELISPGDEIYSRLLPGRSRRGPPRISSGRGEELLRRGALALLPCGRKPAPPTSPNLDGLLDVVGTSNDRLAPLSCSDTAHPLAGVRGTTGSTAADGSSHRNTGGRRRGPAGDPDALLLAARTAGAGTLREWPGEPARAISPSRGRGLLSDQPLMHGTWLMLSSTGGAERPSAG